MTRGHRLRSLAGAGMALLLLLLTCAEPAGAHAGGRAQLYLASLVLAPETDGWSVAAQLRDLDSGRPEPGFRVTVSGRTAAGEVLEPLELVDGNGEGLYQAHLMAPPGAWTLSVRAEEIPGGPLALPYSRAWNVTLLQGQRIDLIRHSARQSAGSGPNRIPLILSTATAVVAGAAAVVFSRRRRRPGCGTARSTQTVDNRGPV